MHEKWIRNILLTIIAALLLLNLGVMLSPVTHAIPNAQYKAAEVRLDGGDPNSVQRTLDQQSAQGWQYVGSAANVLIFKK